MNVECLQFALNLLASILQLVALGQLLISALEAKRKIASDRYGLVDAGDAFGGTEGEHIATAIGFLLKEKSNVVPPLITIGFGSILQIVALTLGLGL